VERWLSNFEMSAPETKALPPAPDTTRTRSAGSAAKSASSAVMRSHMSSETALWRAGLLNTISATAPRLRPSIFSSTGASAAACVLIDVILAGYP
jgi:hypothetical protein